MGIMPLMVVMNLARCAFIMNIPEAVIRNEELPNFG
jgi:hypothetical protein